MARKPAVKTRPATIDPDAFYMVRLTRLVQVGPFKHSPVAPIRMKGKLLQRIIDQEGDDVLASADL